MNHTKETIQSKAEELYPDLQDPWNNKFRREGAIEMALWMQKEYEAKVKELRNSLNSESIDPEIAKVLQKTLWDIL